MSCTGQKTRKRRWTSEENSIFQKFFKKYITEKILPPGRVIELAQKQLNTRTKAQLRTRIHNVINGKQTL